MDEAKGLSHSKWECKYHVVFIPKCRRRILYEQLRRQLVEVFHELARQRESWIEEGHLMPDHAHMLISIPAKYAVSQVVGYIKGRSRNVCRGTPLNFARLRTAGKLMHHHDAPGNAFAHVHRPGVASPAVRVDAASSATRPRIALCSCFLEASGTISV